MLLYQNVSWSCSRTFNDEAAVNCKSSRQKDLHSLVMNHLPFEKIASFFGKSVFFTAIIIFSFDQVHQCILKLQIENILFGLDHGDFL